MTPQERLMRDRERRVAPQGAKLKRTRVELEARDEPWIRETVLSPLVYDTCVT